MSKKVLIIEDDLSAARLTEYTLEQAGYEVITAYDGFDGLDKAVTECPDLIILDVMLPGLDGYEVCRQLRQESETATLPILIISAKARDDDRDIGLRVGADAYIAKPVDPSVIIQKVEDILSNTGNIVYYEF